MNDTFSALRFSGFTDIPAMQYQPVVEIGDSIGRTNSNQLVFYLPGCF